MVATIHRDPYRLLIRKIGYSVGLENTLERVGALASLYAREGSVTSASIAVLIHERWGLKTNNILDVLNELDLVRSEANTIFVLPTLDALGILRSELDDEDFAAALRAVLLSSILSSDGDIFLNCLSAEFDRDAVRARLIDMIEIKRALARQALRSPRAASKVDRFIVIETQRSNKGGALAGQGINALQRREALDVKRGPLAVKEDSQPTVSDDYLRKVPGRRRDWAITIGLATDDGSLSEAGIRLLRHFAGLGQSAGATFAFWPYPDELSQLNLREAEVPWTTPTREAVIFGLKQVTTGRTFGAALASQDATIAWLHNIFLRYRTLNPGRSIVRVELPLRVARLVALGFAVARQGVDHDVQTAVETAQRLDLSLEIRPSRQHEGSIVFRSK